MSAPGFPASSTPSEQGGNPLSVIDEGNINEQQTASLAASESTTETHNEPAVDEGIQKEQSSEMTGEDHGESRNPANDQPGPTAGAIAKEVEHIQQESITGKMKVLSVSTDIDPSPRADTQTPPPLPEKDNTYLNAKPTSPVPPLSPAASEWTEKELPNVPAGGELDEKAGNNGEKGGDEESQSEIQSIMGQFTDPARNNDQGDIMSPRMELAEQFLGGSNQFPPRKSSLEHLQINPPISGDAASSSTEAHSGTTKKDRGTTNEAPGLNRRASTSTIPPPPAPEPDQPFDFHRFLEQLRHRTADPVAKFLRSFLMEFGKRQWMAHEQVKIISDFLAFITNKMAQCEVWRGVSDSEFDNAKEGMEKLVMNRLYSQTFSPMIPPPPAVPRTASRSKRRELERRHGPWRRGQHQEDVERDEILAQKIRIYSWVREEHLDIPPVNQHGRRFLSLAQQGERLSLVENSLLVNIYL